MKKLFMAAAMAGVLGAGTANASHIWVTDPSVNGVALDSPAGFTNPTINAPVGSILDVLAGFYDYCGGTCSENWTMHFDGGPLSLADVTLFIVPGSSSPDYVSFTQELSTVGTFSGFLQPIQDESCPSYRYGTGVEGGDGCGGPSESIPFTLNVTAAAVPEPGSLALLATGLGAFGLIRRRKAA